MTPRPPRIAERLLSLALPGGGIRESVLGDLHEMYRARVGSDGAGSARRWYWGQAVRLAMGYGTRRLRGDRFRGFAPAPTPSEVRGVNKGDGMGGLIRQLRLSFRALTRSPAFTVPALLILAIGMTAATAVFTVADSVLFRALDLPDSHELVIVCEDHARLQGSCIASPVNVEDFRRSTSTLTELGVGRGRFVILTDELGTEGVRAGIASAGFLRALGVQPVLGRLFTDEEFGPDNDDVALLSHAFWMSRYGGDPEVVGSSLTMNGEPSVVVGILPSGFDLPLGLAGFNIWRPLHFNPLDPEFRNWRGFRAIGRLADGATVASASAELSAMYRGLAEEHEEVDDEWRLRVDALQRVVVGDTRPVLLAFLGAAGLLLLIVCANVANLLLARGIGRRQELAVRAAMGAERFRLVREIFTESLVLSGLAAALALALSGSAVRLMVALAPQGIPRLDEVSMEFRVLAFAVVVSAMATVVFSALPALRVTDWDLSQALKGTNRSGSSRRSMRLQNGLVVVEVALSVVLLASAALLSRSFIAYLRWDPGFEVESLFAVSGFLDPGEYDDLAQVMSTFRQAEEYGAATPGVISVATASAGPLFGGGDGALPFVVEGVEVTGPLPTVRWFDVGPGYFATLGLPMVRGREFTEADVEDGPRVCIVNESFVRRALGDGPVLGRTVRLPERGDIPLEIVGVVPDVPSMVPGEEPYPEIYWPNRQNGRIATMFLVRTTGDPTALFEPVKDALQRADPDMSLGTPFTLSSQAASALVRPRFQALILVAFALAALILSAVGVYAVVSYAAARRTREVGIRVALGARRNDVIRLMARTSLAVVGVGVLAGLVGAFLVGRVIQGLIPGVSPGDLVSLGGGAAALLLVALLATLIPARRASRVDPLEAIRVE